MEAHIAYDDLHSGQGLQVKIRLEIAISEALLSAIATTVVSLSKEIFLIALINVNILNLFQLAPGGHRGRFITWAKKIFSNLANYLELI